MSLPLRRVANFFCDACSGEVGRAYLNEGGTTALDDPPEEDVPKIERIVLPVQAYAKDTSGLPKAQSGT